MTAVPALLIDIGNTRIKWAWCADRSAPGASASRAPTTALPVPWQAAGAEPHARMAELAAAWRTIAAASTVPEVWISNVAGPVAAQAVDAALAQAFGAPPVVERVRSTDRHGLLDNGYRQPSQLGVDRWLGAIGARHAVPDGHLLIVTAGTATTIDVISAAPAGGPRSGRSRFEGGLILPGLALMMASLARNTAQLPALDVGDTGAAPPWADNTHDAIAAGCLLAQTGAIEQAWRALAGRGATVALTGAPAGAPAQTPIRGLLSGGAREALARALSLPFAQHENLVLLGLWVLASDARAPRP